MKLKADRLKLSVNTKGRDFVVGDIHGHVSKLHNALNDINFDPKVDRLICVGDLIDRGPESVEALALLNEPWFYSVLGNHEYMMVSGMKYHNNKNRMTWLKHGGEWIMNTSSEQWPTWFKMIEDLPMTIEVENADGIRYGIVHADYPHPYWNEFGSFTEEMLQRCLWSRSNFQSGSKHSVNDIDFLIHGHNVSDGETQLGNRFYIEPGVFLGADFIIKQL